MNFSGNARGINATGMKKLSMVMLDYEEEFNKIFSEIELVMEKVNSNLSGDVGTALSENYKELSLNFPIVSNSMRTYSDDFINVIKSYEKNDIRQADIF